MSEGEGYRPPEAEKWQAPSTEGDVQEESSEQKFFREKEERLLEADIPKGDRIEADNRIIFTPPGEKFSKSKDFFDDAFLQQHRGEFGTNNSTICFIDKSGHPWVTFDTAFKRRALERAGYKSSGGDINVPFSNGEELHTNQWQFMENGWRAEKEEEEKLEDTPGAKTAGERMADINWDEIRKKKEQKK